MSENRPRTEVSIDTSLYATYSGYYRLKDGPFYVVTAKDGRLFTRVVGQSDIEIFPESETEFFMKVLPVQVTFVRDSDGAVDTLVHHQNGTEILAERVAPELVERAEEELRRRIEEKISLPNSEALIRRIIAEHLRGEPDFDSMAPAWTPFAVEPCGFPPLICGRPAFAMPARAALQNRQAQRPPCCPS